ncbi:MAG TPA: hypothetical protein VLM40_13630 [Gemmata sp.]|nr:hypothetical protein [Gemmata sp.]
MKRILAAAIVAAVGSSALVGCSSGSQGGPGASNKGGVVSPSDDAFTLSVPTLSTKIKQGEAKVVEIGIKRGKNFGQDVSLKLDGLPMGVTADPSTPDIKAGQEEAKVTLKAADTAALGDFTVKVTGHPKTGADATNEFKLTIDKK